MGPKSLRTSAVLALVVLTFGAAGCGSSKSSKAAEPTTPAADTETTTTEAATPTTVKAAAPEACALVTKSEAEGLAGTPLDPPLAVKETCTYTGPVTGPTAQVEVFVGDGARKFFETDRDTLEHQFADVPGVGDEAHEEDGVIFFKKGATWVSIRLTSLNDPADDKLPLEAAAKTAAGRF